MLSRASNNSGADDVLTVVRVITFLYYAIHTVETFMHATTDSRSIINSIYVYFNWNSFLSNYDIFKANEEIQFPSPSPLPANLSSILVWFSVCFCFFMGPNSLYRILSLCCSWKIYYASLMLTNQKYNLNPMKDLFDVRCLIPGRQPVMTVRFPAAVVVHKSFVCLNRKYHKTNNL